MNLIHWHYGSHFEWILLISSIEKTNRKENKQAQLNRYLAWIIMRARSLVDMNIELIKHVR